MTPGNHSPANLNPAGDTPLGRVLAKLPDAKRSGGQWMARCPAHDDHKPSLSITEANDGKVLLTCWSQGCPPASIVAAVELTMADLFPAAAPGRQTPGRRTAGSSTSASRTRRDHGPDNGHGVRPRPRKTYSTAEAAVAVLERQLGTPAATYRYTDAAGETVGLVLRWETADGGKTFRPVSHYPEGSGSGGWCIAGMPEGSGGTSGGRPLYGLDVLADADPDSPVFVTEREKDADGLLREGLFAVTCAGGSKAADRSDWSPLAGRGVVILPDHDEPGRAFAEQVATLLVKLDPPASVKVLDLGRLPGPGLPDKGDVSDWLADGHDIAELLRLAGEAERWMPPATPPRDRGDARGTDGPPAWQPFPLHAMPGPTRGVVQRAAKAIGCDPSMVALPMLAALASLVGNTRRVEVKRGWAEPCILWTATVLRSGGGKSPAFDVGTAAVNRLQSQLITRYRDEAKAHETAAALHDRDLKQWKHRKRDPIGNDLPPEAPPEPTLVSLTTMDATVEALAALLQDNPRGLLLARDELSGWIGSFDKYAKGGGSGGGVGNAAHWLTMHGGRNLRVDRKTDQRLTYVPAASVSITGTIQPAILRRVLGEVNLENGMDARLMLAMPPQRPRRWTDDEVSDDDRRLMEQLAVALYALQPAHDDAGEAYPHPVKLSPEARLRFIDFFNAHNAEREDLDTDELAAAWAKLEGGAARLALIHHLIRVVAPTPGSGTSSDTPPVDDPDRIDAVSMDAGITLSRWFASEARRIYAMLRETDDQARQRKLTDWINGRGGQVSVRDLTHNLRRYRNHSEQAQADLNALADAGVARWHHPSGPGHPSPKLQLLHTAPGDTDTDTPTHHPAAAVSGVGVTGDAPIASPE